MKKILIMDEKNYTPEMEEIYRIAVRGIIFIDDKLLLIQSNDGELKFPGGGQEDGEDDIQTLTRETLEETGYHVISDSVCEFGEIEERRLSTHEEKIWHQINRYYFCKVYQNRDECNYSESEKELGFHHVLFTLDEAISMTQKMLRTKGKHSWNQREYNALIAIKEHFDH